MVMLMSLPWNARRCLYHYRGGKSRLTVPWNFAGCFSHTRTVFVLELLLSTLACLRRLVACSA